MSERPCLRLILADAIDAGDLLELWPDAAAPSITLGVVYPSRRELPHWSSTPC